MGVGEGNTIFNPEESFIVSVMYSNVHVGADGYRQTLLDLIYHSSLELS